MECIAENLSGPEQRFPFTSAITIKDRTYKETKGETYMYYLSIYSAVHSTITQLAPIAEVQ